MGVTACLHCPGTRFDPTPQARYAVAGRYFARLKRNTLDRISLSAGRL